MKIRVYASSIDVSAAWSPATPLWQVAPTRDSEGRLGVLDEYCPHRLVSLAFGRN